MVIWISFDSRCKPKPGEGTTDSHKEAQGEATDRRALLAGEEDSDKIWKCWAWIIPDKTFWRMGESRAELTDIENGGERFEAC